ncbi:hypothetical protein [Methanonatronarchaeum sp. AMET6-2]|uniref:hypothetical protein n=1 Tax=Methanonatronarchaeum sp. AMET6-2 TaxID=2933293 RepID=UPI0012016F32|nr:hypothetical protein [Methanonatronarchaeum sp. AMET6-2]RZN61264.1 MAG: hypothetical protein EF811_05245 [Methanonatronarchaeia archaeon]UOY10251.1 hypothetical protein MU439_01065 [Methanonatronarchaeum sp. AMET6-2]
MNDDVVERFKSALGEIKGVGLVRVLSSEEKDRVIELEKEAEGNVIMGLGRGDNQGVKQALDRDVTVVFTTDKDFRWPEGSNVVIKHEGEVIGEEIDSEEELRRLEQSERDVSISGSFVLYKDKLDTGAMHGGEEPVVLFPAKRFRRLEDVDDCCDPVFGSPCPPADNYLKEVCGIKDDKEHGTALAGFDLE